MQDSELIELIKSLDDKGWERVKRDIEQLVSCICLYPENPMFPKAFSLFVRPLLEVEQFRIIPKEMQAFIFRASVEVAVAWGMGRNPPPDHTSRPDTRYEG